MSSEPADSGSLLGRYRNAGEIFDDQVLAKPTGEVFHRLDPQADDPHPACHSAPDEDQTQLTSPEAVHQAGLEPCRTCYQAIFEYLGARPESPVEPRNTIDPDTNIKETVEDFEPIQPDPKPPRLSTLTEEVLVRGGSSKVMHAPTEGGPLCGQAGEYRRVEPEVFAGHYRSCETVSRLGRTNLRISTVPAGVSFSSKWPIDGERRSRQNSGGSTLPRGVDSRNVTTRGRVLAGEFTINGKPTNCYLSY